MLANGIVGRVDHGTANLPSSGRYYLTSNGIREAAKFLGFDTPSDFVRAYPMSREWLTLLIHRMDAIAVAYRLEATTTYHAIPHQPRSVTPLVFLRRGICGEGDLIPSRLWS